MQVDGDAEGEAARVGRSGAHVASAAATSPYFSIDMVQSAASGLPGFDARGGVRSIGAGP